MSIPAAPNSVYSKLDFSDDFASWSPWTGPGSKGKWRTSFSYGTQAYSSHVTTEFGSARTSGALRNYYSDAGTFAAVTESGLDCLQITGQKRNWTGYNGTVYSYTSGMINSGEVYLASPPCWIEIKCKHPGGKGIWPAFWLYDHSAISTDEVDIFENSGDSNTNIDSPTNSRAIVTSTIYPGGECGYFDSGRRNFSCTTSDYPNNNAAIPTINDGTTTYYTMSCEWTESFIKFYYNRVLLWTFLLGAANDAANRITSLSAMPKAEMDVLCTLQLGNGTAFTNFIGDVASNASINTTPVNMFVDYVAVWKPPTGTVRTRNKLFDTLFPNGLPSQTITEQYMRDIVESVTPEEHTLALTAGALTWDVAADPVASVILDANATITILNGEPGRKYRLALIQDTTGSRTVTVGSAVQANAIILGTPPWRTAAGNVNILELTMVGTKLYGTVT